MFEAAKGLAVLLLGFGMLGLLRNVETTAETFIVHLALTTPRPAYDQGRFETITMRNFDSLSEREIVALAIALEEEDERIYADFADGLRPDFPASAAVFDGMRAAESSHR
jgi:rubrerythrin